VKRYALRSKKSGNYFNWHEYSSDGWGEYHDDVTPKGVQRGELPALFGLGSVQESNKHGYPRCSLKDHGIDDVDVIAITIQVEGIVKT